MLPFSLSSCVVSFGAGFFITKFGDVRQVIWASFVRSYILLQAKPSQTDREILGYDDPRIRSHDHAGRSIIYVSSSLPPCDILTTNAHIPQCRPGYLTPHRRPRSRWSIFSASHRNAGRNARQRHGDQHCYSGTIEAAWIYYWSVCRTSNMVLGKFATLDPVTPYFSRL